VRHIYLLQATHATRRVIWGTCSEYPFSFWRSHFLCCICYYNRLENGWKFTPLWSFSTIWYYCKCTRIWPVSCPTDSNRGRATGPGSFLPDGNRGRTTGPVSFPPDGKRPEYWSGFPTATETNYWSSFLPAWQQRRTTDPVSFPPDGNSSWTIGPIHSRRVVAAALELLRRFCIDFVSVCFSQSHNSWTALHHSKHPRTTGSVFFFFFFFGSYSNSCRTAGAIPFPSDSNSASKYLTDFVSAR